MLLITALCREIQAHVELYKSAQGTRRRTKFVCKAIQRSGARNEDDDKKHVIQCRSK